MLNYNPNLVWINRIPVRYLSMRVIATGFPRNAVDSVCDRIFILHTGNSFRKLIKSTRNQIVFTNFWLIWNQTDVRLVLNQPENGKYNLISGWFNKFSETFLCVYIPELFWILINASSLLYYVNFKSSKVSICIFYMVSSNIKSRLYVYFGFRKND